MWSCAFTFKWHAFVQSEGLLASVDLLLGRAARLFGFRFSDEPEGQGRPYGAQTQVKRQHLKANEPEDCANEIYPDFKTYERR